MPVILLKITLVNSQQHQNTNLNSDFELKNQFQTFVSKIYDNIQSTVQYITIK